MGHAQVRQTVHDTAVCCAEILIVIPFALETCGELEVVHIVESAAVVTVDVGVEVV